MVQEMILFTDKMVMIFSTIGQVLTITMVEKEMMLSYLMLMKMIY